MLCISRYTDDTYAQLFGDGRHKFYLEFRCSRPCLKGLECCVKCAEKSPSTVLQHSRKFNHCNVNELIPDGSHIFGGKWYYEAARKWGAPPSEIIEFAMQYQKEARGDFVVEQPRYDESYKAEKLSVSQEMPPRAKNTATPIEGGEVMVIPPKRTRKPKVAVTEESVVVPAPKPRSRKPKVAPDQGADGAVEAPKKRGGGRKKVEDTPYSSLVGNTNTMVHKEAVLPTHIESSLEKIDVDGYEIEYVKLSTFEVGETTYYRDSRKNKLYKKLKGAAIGNYVGRWNPDTGTIITEIPDSDDEN